MRYAFDVVGTVIDYHSLSDASGNELTPGTADYDAFVAAYHPLAHLVGQTGRTVFEIKDYDDWQSGNYAGAQMQCLSGLFCPATPGSFVAFNSSTGFSIYGSRFLWELRGGRLTFSDDGGIADWGTLNGSRYLWWDPRAAFTLTNLSITEVTGQTAPAAVPLPAAGWFYALILLPLLRRHRGQTLTTRSIANPRRAMALRVSITGQSSASSAA